VLAVIAGIVFIITGIVLWLANLSMGHALAIFIGVIGILLIAYWAYPAGWTRRA
jgi:hypothetical protein